MSNSKIEKIYIKQKKNLRLKPVLRKSVQLCGKLSVLLIDHFEFQGYLRSEITKNKNETILHYEQLQFEQTLQFLGKK